MIDYIFWLMDFKMETLADKVIIYIICIMHIITIFFDRFVSASFVLLITCGRTNALLLRSLWMTWAIGFALSCVRDVFRTSSKPIRMVLPLALLGQRLDRTL